MFISGHLKMRVCPVASVLTGKELFLRNMTYEWQTLPAAYQESPFLNLDVDILFKPIDHILDEVEDTPQSCDVEKCFQGHKGKTGKLP